MRKRRYCGTKSKNRKTELKDAVDNNFVSAIRSKVSRTFPCEPKVAICWQQRKNCPGSHCTIPSNGLIYLFVVAALQTLKFPRIIHVRVGFLKLEKRRILQLGTRRGGSDGVRRRIASDHSQLRLVRQLAQSGSQTGGRLPLLPVFAGPSARAHRWRRGKAVGLSHTGNISSTKKIQSCRCACIEQHRWATACRQISNANGNSPADGLRNSSRTWSAVWPWRKRSAMSSLSWRSKRRPTVWLWSSSWK